MSARSDDGCQYNHDDLETAIRDHGHKELAAVGRIIDVLEGEEVEHLDGSMTRPEAGGVVGRVGKLEAGQVEIMSKLDNGIKLKLSKSQKAALTTLLLSIATMLVNHIA